MRLILLAALISLPATAFGARDALPPSSIEGRLPVEAAPASLGSAQSDLDGAAAAFARAWMAEEVGAIASRMSAEGIRLQLGGEDHPVLGARQARAALEDFLGSRSTRALQVSRVVDLGGSPPRGFAEVRWEAVVDRTSEPLVHTVFVSYQRDDAGWRITEIRVL